VYCQLVFRLNVTGKTVQRLWTFAEKEEVQVLFMEQILSQKLPQKRIIEAITAKSTHLTNRPWRSVRDHIRNHYVKN